MTDLTATAAGSGAASPAPDPAAPPRWPTAQCGGCRAPIIWAITAARGERMPVDAVPVGPGAGNILLTPGPGRAEPTAEVIRNPAKLFGRRWVYRSHFASCTDAGYNRRPRSRA